jgi:Glycosyl hydrolases family 2, sugar binding domain/Glycosyl hydrolases family 2/Glycosyl hydrolases family 2, TIM barrel domain
MIHSSFRPAARVVAAALLVLASGAFTPASAQAPAQKLRTRWAAEVSPSRALPEYPRPQMVRPAWQNLNGEWDYAVLDAAAPEPRTFTGHILVPFAIQSQLSGVGTAVSDTQRLWYRRTFRAPALARGSRLLLHFGAVDWQTQVMVNGKPVGTHTGGYDPFSFDVTEFLKPSGDQVVVVSVTDPTDRGTQPRGKQVLEPKSIWYTAVTGIWQTVWIEPVPAAYISGLELVPDATTGSVAVRVVPSANGAGVAHVSALEGSRVVAETNGQAGERLVLRIPGAKLWSPENPFLYNLRVRLGRDEVRSYVGIRSISVARDAAGVNRLFLNGKPLFQYGLLDQGWWPDGLYTAPTDEALRSDIERSKALGFNLIRKHVKVEPARWYYHCDRLGMLVWQDMPSGPDKPAENRAAFAPELEHVVDALKSYTSIVMWVPFNEGWGQHETEKYVAWLKERDPSRLVNNTSGWTDTGVGDVSDVHSYPGPAMPLLEDKRAAVLGEFGGLGLPLEGHTWIDKGNWGYRSYKNTDELGQAYRDLMHQLRIMVGEGLAAAIYTQTTDVEIEVNGMMTYDRAVVKLPQDAVALHAALASPPAVRDVVPSSDRAPQQWRYTTTAPAPNWSDAAFDDGGWERGNAGFGKPDTQRARVGTPWLTPDIWLRRTFDMPSRALINPHLRIYHDDDAEVFVNGARVATLPGAIGGYAYIPLDAAAAAQLHHGASNVLAIHVKQLRGGQFIDAGIVEVIENAK